MASSSSSSSSLKRKRSYDVLLSFRGTDVRNNFLGHLYAALDQNGIFAYIDSEELRKGEQILPALMNAIEESRVAIIIFSEDYASSPWCLEEVAMIMECKERRDLVVFPVFYKVEPCEVRTPKKSYKEAMAKHEIKFGKDAEKVKRWKNALLAAGNLSGWHFTDGRNVAPNSLFHAKTLSSVGHTAQSTLAQYMNHNAMRELFFSVPLLIMDTLMPLSATSVPLC